MISYPPRAQLSDTLLVNGQQSTRSIQELHRAGRGERNHPVTPTEPQSSSSLVDSLLHSDKDTLHASSPWSIGSPLSGSTLCPTPQSSQFEYDGIGRDWKPYPGPRHAPSSSGTTAPTSYTVETWHPIDDAGRIRKWKSHLYRLSPFTTLISMVAYFLYYTYRIHCTLDAQRAFNQVYIMAWIFISAEGCVACECSRAFVSCLELRSNSPDYFPPVLPDAIYSPTTSSQAASPRGKWSYY
jgi:hypothetical protein